MTAPDELAELGRTWNRLLAHSSSRTAFLTWEWVQSWWRCFGRSRELVVLVCSDAAGKLMGIAPLTRTRERIFRGIDGRVLRLIGDGIGGSENLDWIVRQGFERAVVQAFVDWIARNSSQWDILDMDTVPATSPVARLLREEMSSRRWLLREQQSEGFLLRLPGTWEACLVSVSKNMRHSLNYSLKRATQDFELHCRRCESVEELPGCLQQLFDLHAKRWQLRGQKGAFHLPQKREFYGEIARRFLDRGWLAFYRLELNGRVVAVEFGLVYDRTYSFLQSGFDPDYAGYAVGRVLRALIIQDLIRQGVRGYDFLGGGDPYKQRWGTDRLTYLRLTCARPLSRGALALTLRQCAAKTKEYLRARLPAPAWSVLKSCYRRIIANPAAAAG